MNPIIPYSDILPEFCAQRCVAPSVWGNFGPITTNPRIIFLRKLMFDLGLDYETDMWEVSGMTKDGSSVFMYNFYLRGTSNKMIVAHHDIANPRVDNCNDNSASVINALAAKVLNPEVNVCITDCEEFGGKGAQRLSNKINAGYFGEIEYVVNLELTAVGGMNFFTERIPMSGLYQKIQTLFPHTPTVFVPFHDGMIFRRNGIDSLVINPLPVDENGRMKLHYLNFCHSERDTIELANYEDMDTFVRFVVTPLIK